MNIGNISVKNIFKGNQLIQNINTSTLNYVNKNINIYNYSIDVPDNYLKNLDFLDDDYIAQSVRPASTIVSNYDYPFSNWYAGRSPCIFRFDSTQDTITKLVLNIEPNSSNQGISGYVFVTVYFYGTSFTLNYNRNGTSNVYWVQINSNIYNIEDPYPVICELYYNNQDNTIHKKIGLGGNSPIIDEPIDYSLLFNEIDYTKSLPLNLNCQAGIDAHDSESDGNWRIGRLEFVVESIKTIN